MGHELGHTFMENADALDLLPVFSREAQACITNQYRKTCTEFKEVLIIASHEIKVISQVSCDPGIKSLDDDGADIIGLQLAYESLSRYYGSELHVKGDTKAPWMFTAFRWKMKDSEWQMTSYFSILLRSIFVM